MLPSRHSTFPPHGRKLRNSSKNNNDRFAFSGVTTRKKSESHCAVMRTLSKYQIKNNTIVLSCHSKIKVEIIVRLVMVFGLGSWQEITNCRLFRCFYSSPENGLFHTRYTFLLLKNKARITSLIWGRHSD